MWAFCTTVYQRILDYNKLCKQDSHERNTLKEETVVGRNCRGKKLSRRFANAMKLCCVDCRERWKNPTVAEINRREVLGGQHFLVSSLHKIEPYTKPKEPMIAPWLVG